MTRSRQSILTAALAAALGLSPGLAAAFPVSFGGDWTEQNFSLFSGNDYRLQGDAVTVLSDGAVSLIWTALPPAARTATQASWTWQVDAGVPPTDLTQKGGDDRNLALYFVFLPAAEAERASGDNIRALLRNDAARVLVYTWGGVHARGDVLSSPYLGARGRTVVLRPSGTGSARESVDLSRDYSRAFGAAPERLVGLAVSADSDDTDSVIEATVSNLTVE